MLMKLLLFRGPKTPAFVPKSRLLSRGTNEQARFLRRGYWGRAGFTVGFGAGDWLDCGMAGLTRGLAAVPGVAVGEDGGSFAAGVG
jgi:hypothetical protein